MMMLGLFDQPPTTSATLLLDATPFLTGCSISTNEQGFERLTAQVNISLLEAFRLYDKVAPAYVGLVWNGAIVWEGRLEDPTLWAGRNGSGFSIQALGAIRALSDAPYTALWSTTQLNDFVPIVAAQAGGRTPEKWEFSTDNNTIFIAPKKNENFANGGNIGEIGIQTPVGGSRTIIGVSFDLEYLMPVNWNFNVTTFNRDFTGGLAPYALVGTGAVQTRGINLALTARDRLCFTVFNNTGGNVLKATDTGTEYARITNIRVVTSNTNRINTTMTVARAPGVNVTCTVGSTAGMYVGQRLCINSTGNPSESVIVLSIGSSTQFNATFVGNYAIGSTVTALVVYADEIAKDMVAAIAALNSSQLNSSTARIQSPGLDLTDEMYEDADMLSVLTHLSSLGDNQMPPRRWEVGVYEDRKLFFRPQLSASRAWYVDVTDLEIDRTLDALRNSRYATYQDANSVTLRTAVSSDATSVQRYGITRRAAVSASTTSATQAGVIRDTALQDTKDPKPRARISFNAVYDITGACYPLWMVRAGDTITIRNLPPSSLVDVDRLRTFRITHTDYDVMADTLEVEPEAPPPILETMLARREEGITS